MTLPKCYRCGTTPCNCNCSVYHGNCLDILALLPEKSVQCVVTSPPYWGLRDYNVDGQLGLEPTPAEYVANMIGVFRQVRRVLRDDGTVWLNLGDTYNSGNSGARDPERWPKQSRNNKQTPRTHCDTLKHKDLVGIPWAVAFALRDDGWYLRQDIIWSKPNPMPESVRDRCCKSHEYIFLLSKGPRYFYDAEAIREDGAEPARVRNDRMGGANGETVRHSPGGMMQGSPTRNKRSVWTVATKSFSEAHFATFPPKLIEPCILAGTSEEGCCPECGAPWKRVVEKELVSTKKAAKTFVVDERDCTADGNDQGSNRQKDGHKPGWINAIETTGWEPTCDCGGEPVPCTCLDPFHGAGTSGVVAQANHRRYVGIELNEEYIDISLGRLRQETLF